MERPEITHQWVVTYDGKNPEDTFRSMLFASSYEQAVREYEDWAIDNGYPLDNVTFWYQLTAVARSDWTPVGEDTDYDQLMDVIWREFRTTEPSPEIFGSHPTDSGKP